MRIKNIIPTVFVASLALVSCENIKDRAKNYMKNKPQEEYANIINTSNSATMQSRLDSVAYMDILKTTEAANNSDVVSQYNKIAAYMRGYDEDNYITESIYSKIRNRAIEQGMPFSELKKMEDKAPCGNNKRTNLFQHYVDDWAYRKFFKKIGILDDNISARCDSISKIIRSKTVL